MKKSKAEKSPWVKKKKKTCPKKKEKASFCQAKKKNLAESDKGSWFGQTPSTSSASAEDPKISSTLGASSLKIKANVSAGCKQDSSSESGGSDEEEEECHADGPKHWSSIVGVCCNTMLFPGNCDLLSKTLGGPVVPLACGFVRRDNLRAWRELFTNLYKLKSRI